jgi:transcription antitermination factor NusG
MKLIDPSLTWYVATCRTGSEERAWLELRAGGIEAYFPRSLRKVFNRRVRVHRTVEEAAIKGYIFIAGPVDWGKIHADRAYEHVGRPLGVDGPEPIPGHALLQISVDEMAGAYDLTGATKKANSEKLRALFPQGRRLRVREGHLSGFDAVADAVTAGDRIRALVSILGRMVPIEFDVDELERVA